MGPPIECGNLPVWKSPELSTAFFEGSEALREINQAASQPLLENRWQVTLMVELAAYGLSVIAWEILSLISYVCSSSLYTRCSIYNTHAKTKAFALYYQMKYKEHFLCPSINTHRIDRPDIYLRPRDTESRLPDNSPLFVYEFSHSIGLCKGISYWFLHLYFQTKSSFADPKLHMRAIARQFSQGAPAQATLLHLFNASKKGDRPWERHFPDLTFEENIEATYPLAPGAYTFFSDMNHQVVFIKIDAHLAFLFDPQYGCFIIDDALPLDRVFSQRIICIDRVQKKAV